MIYGEKLLHTLEKQLYDAQHQMADGYDASGDCLPRLDPNIALTLATIDLLRNGKGEAWFAWLADRSGRPVKEMKWVTGQYGDQRRIVTASGLIMWTAATTLRGLKAKGLHPIEIRHAARVELHATLLGGYRELVMSTINDWTGEPCTGPTALREVQP